MPKIFRGYNDYIELYNSVVSKISKAALDQGIIDKLSVMKKRYNFIDLYGMIDKNSNEDKSVILPIELTDEESKFSQANIFSTFPIYETQLVRFNKYAYRLIRFRTIDPSDLGDNDFEHIMWFCVQTYGFIGDENIWSFGEEYEACVGLRTVDGKVNIALIPFETMKAGIKYCYDNINWDYIELDEVEKRFVMDGRFMHKLDDVLSSADNKKWIDGDMSLILMYFSKINYILSNKKPKALRGKKAKSIVGYDKSKTGEPKRKITRIVDGIRITSEKPPKTFETNRAINYRVAKWNRRGYVRKLKNGNSVYVKPAVCHRKGLSDIEDKQAVRKSDLIFVKKEEENE